MELLRGRIERSSVAAERADDLYFSKGKLFYNLIYSHNISISAARPCLMLLASDINFGLYQ